MILVCYLTMSMIISPNHTAIDVVQFAVIIVTFLAMPMKKRYQVFISSYLILSYLIIRPRFGNMDETTLIIVSIIIFACTFISFYFNSLVGTYKRKDHLHNLKTQSLIKTKYLFFNIFTHDLSSPFTS